MLRNKNNNIVAAITEILDSIRKSKHAETKNSPHFLHFDREANTPFSKLHSCLETS